MKFVTLARAIAAACLISCAAQAQTVTDSGAPEGPETAGVPGSLLSAATTNGTLVRTGGGSLTMLAAINTNAVIYYAKLYDKATAPVCGTDTPVLRLPVPAASTGAGFILPIPTGARFFKGIGICLTGALADNDTTVAATGVALSWIVK